MAICGNCFNQITNTGVCPYCSYDSRRDAKKHPTALPTGTVLDRRYIVGRVLGQGGFGVTYLALDYASREHVAIKEYFPMEFSARGQGMRSVQVYTEKFEEDFVEGKRKFLEEAKTLAELVGDAHIVRIYRYFEENNTAYFAMEYIRGQGLKSLLEEGERILSVSEANSIFLPLMQSLSFVHAKGIVHRDISPSNIIVEPSGNAKLIDFGSARYSTGEMSQSLDMILKHGFAPPEQYVRRSRQGPFTDIYALAATYYYAVTGRIPPDAVERMTNDTLIPPSRLNSGISRKLDSVLIKALAPNYKDRFQTMAEFRTALLDTAFGKNVPVRGNTSSGIVIRAARAALLVILLVFGGIKLAQLLRREKETVSEPESTVTVISTEDELIQEIEPSEEPSPALPQKPSAADLDAINADIVYPRKESYYLEEYETKYVQSRKGNGSVYSFKDPNSSKDVMRAGNYFFVNNGTEAIVLARAGGYSCVIFPELNQAGWINSDYLVS
jgi:serine/threonine protein kinase